MPKRICRGSAEKIVVAKSKLKFRNGHEQIEVLKKTIKEFKDLELYNTQSWINMSQYQKSKVRRDIINMQLKVNDHEQAKILHRLAKNICNTK